jgi:hypothetical protein
MEASKPVRVTSPANAWATGAQLLAFVVPALSVAEVYQPVALEAVSPILADVWQWILLVVAVIAIASSVGAQVITARGGELITALLRLEAVATLLMALCFGSLWGALVREYGFGSNPLTQAMVGVLALAALGRVAQIVWELWKYHRALRAGKTATVEALAQPKES